MDIDEVQYLSENELVSIVPNFKHPEIHLIRGSVGPFLPLVPLQVPMWMVCLPSSPIFSPLNSSISLGQSFERKSSLSIRLSRMVNT